MSLITGKEFNTRTKSSLFKKKQCYVKLTTRDENHNGLQYTDGLNIDILQFNPNGRCQSGGSYFCKYEDFPLWLHYGNKDMYYLRYVEVLDDALVYIENDITFKTNKILLSERIEIWSNIDL